MTLRQARLPDQTPHGPFDLIVASEIFDDIAPHHLYDLLRKLDLALASGGRIVVLDHCWPFGDAAQLPALAHRRVRQQLQKSMPIVFHERQSRFDVVAFESRGTKFADGRGLGATP